MKFKYLQSTILIICISFFFHTIDNILFVTSILNTNNYWSSNKIDTPLNYRINQIIVINVTEWENILIAALILL